MPRVFAIASFVVDEQNQQNHIIAHEALFQRTGNSECYNGIDYGGKKDTDLYGTESVASRQGRQGRQSLGAPEWKGPPSRVLFFAYTATDWC